MKPDDVDTGRSSGRLYAICEVSVAFPASLCDAGLTGALWRLR